MRYRNAIAALALSIAVAGCAAGSTPTGHSRQWYDTATCEAFAGWQVGRATFTQVSQLAAHADLYLATDVALLSNAVYTLSVVPLNPVLVGYVADDCTLPAD